jgi:hypothetical protein
MLKMLLTKTIQILYLFSNFIPIVTCYYKNGHSLIGEITDKLLTSRIKTNINMSIQDISSWADSIKKNPNYRWTKILHYINTNDNAENNYCKVEINLDKPNLYNALQNYTQRLLNKTLRTDEDLKFFVHFYQDLFQPLHMSGIYRGGNNYSLNYFGKSSNLHEVWDSLILRDRIKEFRDKDIYINYLLQNYKKIKPFLSFDYKYWIERNNEINCNFVYKDLSNNLVTLNYYNTNKYVIDYLVMYSSINLSFILKNLFTIN